MVPSPQARVYTIESSDPSLSMISSGDESWEHVENDEKDLDDDISLVTDDRKQYADVVKQPVGEEPPRTPVDGPRAE